MFRCHSFTLYIFDFFLRRQVFQERCLLRLTSDQTAKFQCGMRADTNKTNLNFRSKLCCDKKLEIICYFRFFFPNTVPSSVETLDLIDRNRKTLASAMAYRIQHEVDLSPPKRSEKCCNKIHFISPQLPSFLSRENAQRAC